MFNGTVNWYNVDGVHNYDLNDVKSPLTDFDVEPTMRTDLSRNKLMAHGLWRTRTYRGGMSIHVEGNLFGDDSSDYVTERKNLMLALFGDPDTVVTQDYMGTLGVTPAGETEEWRAKCTIDAFQAPVQALYPAITTYLISFQAFDPWFIGATTGNKYTW